MVALITLGPVRPKAGTSATPAAAAGNAETLDTSPPPFTWQLVGLGLGAGALSALFVAGLLKLWRRERCACWNDGQYYSVNNEIKISTGMCSRYSG